MMFFLSKYQANEILKAYKRGLTEYQVSLNLGRSIDKIEISDGSVIFPDEQRISLDLIKKINDDSCVIVDNNKLLKIQFFSKETNKIYRLVATSMWAPPTLEISGIRMHRTKGTNPLEDTLSKIDAIKPIEGRLLDTCMGLGYTAISAMKENATEVITVENDPNVIEIVRINPWSEELWKNRRIKIIRGDILEEIARFEDRYFNIIIHDPPRFALAGELYSEDFYSELYRVLDSKGKLFHYTGNPGSRYRGKDFISGIIKRLNNAGFKRTRRYENALGVVAKK